MATAVATASKPPVLAKAVPGLFDAAAPRFLVATADRPLSSLRHSLAGMGTVPDLGHVADSRAESRGLHAFPQLHPAPGLAPHIICTVIKHAPAQLLAPLTCLSTSWVHMHQHGFRDWNLQPDVAGAGRLAQLNGFKSNRWHPVQTG